MKLPSLIFISVSLAFVAAACVHTPPGTSVEVALAKKPQVLRLPATPAPLVAKNTQKASVGQNLPEEKTEKVADAFSRGDFCMKAGRDQEAIDAFREAVKLEPKFSEAWNNLAILYEKEGQEDLAVDAFRKSKRIAKE
ncbi:MAG TPA: tetratricopeptide repeat protein [Chthoniobacteraceae bacterium]|jgi:Flp pilus assembly protein TadD